jgi:hypothetical protein
MHYVHDVLKNLHIFHPFSSRIKEWKNGGRWGREDDLREFSVMTLKDLEVFESEKLKIDFQFMSEQLEFCESPQAKRSMV